MTQQTQNIKQQLEEVIKKNLPEKKKVIANMLQDDELYNEKGMDGVKGFNQALSSIDTSLIADEVLKVVVETFTQKIKDSKYVSLHEECIEGKCEMCERCLGKTNANEAFDLCIQLLSEHLSPNKENKNNG